MTAQVERTAGDAGAAGATGAADTAGTGRASRAPGTVRRRALVGAAALLMLTGGATIAHGAADGADGTPAPHGGGHAAHSTGTGAATGTGTTDASDSGKAGGTGEAALVGGASRSGGFWMRADGVFSPPGSFVPSDALTYDTALVPAAARIEITQYADRTSHRVGTRLRGLVPNRAYGMHVHTSPCAADPASAGPHYQHRVAATADPVNEVWLDFRTDRNGNGEAEARHEWGFRDGGARSVIVHDAQGGAGKRVACFTVPFSS
ncbi:superoxide dismutase family protein [Streptomyces cyaneofuscatus]|uniref:Superoxide dismutase family protein n=1 Tax=Streptomyces cyaneofuscatus TaxID=66883 RepID=A0ABZ1ETG3_9ACTN|nr:superoxide dismutase family protein [Streptomyces cyaneofuscatus]WSB07418.1 superoxide dismutase family protein [Streptomyces cyaneofuscatus]WSD49049.1 superoxide dismutase family protein [Streptomyces cyaneofuscatus]